MEGNLDSGFKLETKSRISVHENFVKYYEWYRNLKKECILRMSQIEQKKLLDKIKRILKNPI